MRRHCAYDAGADSATRKAEDVRGVGSPGKVTRVEQAQLSTTLGTRSHGETIARLESAAGSDVPYRGEMEAAFGEDFSGVRAHLGAAEATRPLGAVALARGEMVAFSDQAPRVEAVAHELAHVVQARRNGFAGTGISHPEDPAEREAASVAAAVARGEPAPAISARADTAAHPSDGDAAATGEAVPEDDLAPPARFAGDDHAPSAGLDGKRYGVRADEFDQAARGAPLVAAGDEPRTPRAGDADAAPAIRKPLGAANREGPEGGTRDEYAGGSAHAASAVVPAVHGSPASAPDGGRGSPAPVEAAELAPVLAAAGAVSYRDLHGSVGRLHHELQRTERDQRHAFASPARAVVDLGVGTEPAAPVPVTPPPRRGEASGMELRVGAVETAARGVHPPRDRAAGHVSAGPRPQVPLRGGADPRRVVAARARSHREAANLHRDAHRDAAADFGERSIAPPVVPVSVGARPRGELLPPPRAEPSLPPPVSDVAAKALDAVVGPELTARADRANQRAAGEAARFERQTAERRSVAEARIARSTRRARAEQAALQGGAAVEVEGARSSWRAEHQVLVDQHAERTRALETAQLATTETTVARAQGEIHGELSRAEERGDRERAAARERADAVLAAARSRAGASPDLPVMRLEDPGASGAPDLTQVLAGAEREAADTIAAAEDLIAQMIEAARMQADGRVAALAAEIEQLLTELETDLADANAQLDLAMPLVGERFRTQIQGVLASVRSEVQTVQDAARTGDVVILDEMERELAASTTAHQAQIADIFDDVGHDWRIVEAAEQISGRCRAGDCFERGPDGEYLADENGNLIPNISAGEYMLLFEAAEIQTGIPARLLKAIAEGEAISGVHRDGVPRQFYDGSAISGQATMGGMARWAPEFFSELTDEAIPPVIWGDDSQVDNNGDGVPDGPDTRGIGWMQLTTGADAIRAAWSSGQGTINIAGVEVDLRLAISDPYYNRSSRIRVTPRRATSRTHDRARA